ncbi:hypothetical protein FOA52_002543 [Chlamydomonas sp. UWO 241]|nr:hypothetical protein FOA52_002543 [Chlamydomonas sp. UWO 241]
MDSAGAPPPQHKDSLHGESAAKRQAVGELLFFSSVGDLHRCRKIVAAWQLQVDDPKTGDYDKRTPMHLASAEGCYSVVQWLIAAKAPINAVDRFGRTPLEDAVRGDHGQLAQLLVSEGGKVQNKFGEMVELADSQIANNVRLFSGYDPDWEIDISTLTMMDKIGEGEFGEVYRARWAGTIVAVKILKDFNDLSLGDFRTELNVLQKVHHPHTVQFLGAVTKQQPFMIVTEFMSGGSLLDAFRAKVDFSVWRAIHLALDCARGMAYLHNRSPQAVIHRDLKPANIMLGGFKVFSRTHKELMYGEIGMLKIADFGLSKSLKLNKKRGKGVVKGGRMSIEALLEPDVSNKPSEPSSRGGNLGEEGHKPEDRAPSYKLTGETGSYRFMAPEVFRHEQYNNKVDVYSFSMICYHLFEGLAPFHMLGPVDAARAAAVDLRRPTWGEFNQHGKVVPDVVKRLISACWAPDPEDRPEFEEVIDVLEECLRHVDMTLASDATQNPTVSLLSLSGALEQAACDTYLDQQILTRICPRAGPSTTAVK